MKFKMRCVEATPLGEGSESKGLTVRMVPISGEEPGAPASVKFRLTDEAEVATIELGADYDVEVAWAKAAPAPAAEGEKVAA